MFLLSLNVLTALIKPIVPIDIKSSTSIPVFSNFLDMYTTSLKFRSIKTVLTLSSFSKFCNSSFSSSALSGGGNMLTPPI
ncbi:hypothetical protein SDC9_184665 [bioreactor metagenome]|uniref:Uncharacterized protein n=1 Tax=bioreactor metagenome TaxID=1076179 RepID=A0A645HG51_9ZZZZ